MQRAIRQPLHAHSVLLDLGAREFAVDFDNAQLEVLRDEVVDPFEEHFRARLHIGARVCFAVWRLRVKVFRAQRHDRVHVFSVEGGDVFRVPLLKRLTNGLRLVSIYNFTALGFDLALRCGLLRDRGAGCKQEQASGKKQRRLTNASSSLRPHFLSRTKL